MNPLNVLFKARENRKQELLEYETFLKNTSVYTESSLQHKKIPDIKALDYVERLVKQRQSLLTLELPVKTDTASIGKSLEKNAVPQETAELSNSALRDWRDEKTGYQQYARNSLLNFFKNEIWPKARLVEYDSSGNETIHPPQKLPIQELEHVLTGESFLKVINQKSSNSDSQDVYKSHFNNIWNLIHTPELFPYPFKSEIVIPLQTLAAYFDYLEMRFLNRKLTDSLSSFRDLLEIRLLFYIPTPSTKLCKISLNDLKQVESKESGMCTAYVVIHEDIAYPVPATFVELAQAVLSEGKPFLQKSIKARNRFVENTAKAAGLQGLISPKSIQQSLLPICLNENLNIAMLPRR